MTPQVRPMTPKPAGQAFWPGLDYFLLFSVLVLVGIGVVMVYSASSAVAQARFGSSLYFFKKQAILAAAGVGALFFFKQFDYRYFKPLAYPLLFVAFVLLVCVLIPGLGHTAGGARRWLKLFGFTFQPAEPARLAFVIFLAYSLAKKKDLLDDFYIAFLPHLMVLGVFTFLLFLQPDFGSGLMLAIVTWIVMYLASARVKHLFFSTLILLPAAVLILIMEPYRINRIQSFLNPWAHPTSDGYQIVHSLMAFGSGGVTGQGVGRGLQKLFYLPEPHTDFIFSVVGEELGLLGVFLILALFMVVVWRGFAIAAKTRDLFGRILAGGITASIALHAAVNMAVTLGMMPAKGLTLPFLSYGGTSLVVNLAAVGILLNIEAKTHE